VDRDVDLAGQQGAGDRGDEHAFSGTHVDRTDITFGDDLNRQDLVASAPKPLRDKLALHECQPGAASAEPYGCHCRSTE